MNKWSEFLVKTRIDDSIFEVEDSVANEDRKRIADMRFFCEGVFTDKERVQRVRDRIKKVRAKNLENDDVLEVANLILEELDEIQSDLKFARSRRGKFVLFANDWIQALYETFRKDGRFENLMVASHGECERLVVCGHVDDPMVLAAAVQVIAEHDPLAQIEYRVIVKPQVGEQA